MRNTGSESATVGNHYPEETLGFLSDIPAYKILVSCPCPDDMLLFPYFQPARKGR